MSLADFNSTYLAELAKPTKSPCYIVEFEGIAARFSTKTVLNPDPTKQVPFTYMMNPQLGTSQIRINEGSASLASFTFSILDKYRYLTTNFLTQNVLGNIKVVIKAGFSTIDERFFVTIFTGRVFTFGLDKDNLTWNFMCNSLYQDTQQQIFTAATKLTAPIGPADTTVYVEDTTEFPATSAGVLFLRIDNEVMGYTSKTATSFTVVRENPNVAGYPYSGMRTTADAHNEGSGIQNFAVLQGNPLTLALQVLTSTGAGTNGTYDVLPACCGLAIDKDLVDIAGIELQRNRWLLGYNYRIEAQDSTEGKKFLESELFKFSASYPITDSMGRISLKLLSPPLPTQSIFSVTDDNLEGPPTWQGNFGDKYFFNEIILEYDYDIINDYFRSVTFFEDAASQAKYGIVKTLKMSSKALRTDVSGYGRINNIMKRLLKRFAVPTPILQVQLFSMAQVVRPGDTVILTSTKVPDLIKGTMGTSLQLMEVTELNSNLETGRVTATLNNTGYSYGHKYWTIGPAGMPHYSLATATQRLYGFLSTKESAVSGLMLDGSDAYYITP